jgi:hypothetical protein
MTWVHKIKEEIAAEFQDTHKMVWNIGILVAAVRMQQLPSMDSNQPLNKSTLVYTTHLFIVPVCKHHTAISPMFIICDHRILFINVGAHKSGTSCS